MAETETEWVTRDQSSPVQPFGTTENDVFDEQSPQKRRKIDIHNQSQDQSLANVDTATDAPTKRERVKGVAPIKEEYLVSPASRDRREGGAADDDAAEGAAHEPSGDARDRKKGKSGGQNTSREFGLSKDEVELCVSRVNSDEFSPAECRFGEACRFGHDLRDYLKHKREDLTTFGGMCPIFQVHGRCEQGWKCRFVGSHMTEKDLDGRKELVLIEKASPGTNSNDHKQLLNETSGHIRSDLMKKKIKTPKADEFSKWIDLNGKQRDGKGHGDAFENGESKLKDEQTSDLHDGRADFIDPPFLPSEKRRIYFGSETPVLAPLTTQGNLPFRRLCVDLGAQLTYSEMAMSLPLIQGHRAEWALLRADRSEALPPTYNPTSDPTHSPSLYDNSKDFKFGAQIAANKPWLALKSTEVLTRLCSHLRVIDLNCGCPIDLVFRQGAGSALLDSHSKLDKILRGMNAVSESIPITCKIRMGTRDNRPTALKLVDRLCNGVVDSPELGGSGVAAITLHGRSRQQRYTRSADWSYIADCASLIRSYKTSTASRTDTIREPDPRTLSNTPGGTPYFLGNGDCFSHQDYNLHLSESGVNAIMIGRGALIKPWLFEEISAGQYLDKSASERLGLVEKFARYGLETWGSDERGVGTTRRFLLEWLSFAYRYIPVGLLDHLPPSLQDRPPAWRGRNDLETLLGSDDYKDWIKIR